ncbi:hypothetical protein [Salinispira pacifica]|uniref:Uncharacterized protein n=1 Tax=Salinispira pacifica TaxID=1307761 RepID=V5WGU3_9SPIO|nr:hypothetical protein [Salinispira pacifica]AHC14391.1 hypothetical protein L21SP2_0971 [Salinispira pacifica]
MKLLSTLSFILFFLTAPLTALEVEVEQILDVPPNSLGTFSSSDAAAYASNDQLLLAFSNGFNLFVLEDNQWIPLIDEYRTPQYNNQRLLEQSYGVVYLYNSITSGEFLYYAQIGMIAKEYYRVFVDESGEVQAELVNKEYYDSHLLRYLSRGWSLENGMQLLNGLRIELTPLEMGLQAYWPDIVDAEGNKVYRFTDEFSEAFVEDILTITANPSLDRVAMVISFTKECEEAYLKPQTERFRKLVIFKLSYDE